MLFDTIVAPSFNRVYQQLIPATTTPSIIVCNFPASMCPTNRLQCVYKSIWIIFGSCFETMHIH